MERVFRYATGFIIVSHVINVHYVTYVEAEGLHKVRVHLVNGLNINLKFESKLMADDFIADLMIEVCEFHHINPLPDEVSPRFNTLDITGKTAVEILRDVATRRLQVYETRGEAAESLDIDIRTLKKYTDGES